MRRALLLLPIVLWFGGCGAPPELLSPTAMAVLPDGSVAVADGVKAGVLRVAADGSRTVLTGRGRGAGPPLAEPEALLFADGTLLVADRSSVLAVDLATGDRRLLGQVAGRAVALADGPVVLDEPRRVVQRVSGEVLSPPDAPWRQPAGLTAWDGGFLVADAAAGDLYLLRDGRVRLLSGDLREPEAMAVHGDDVLVADIDGDRILAVPLAGGAAREVSGPGRGAGPPLPEPHDLALREGRLLVLDMALPGLVEVDLATGDRRRWP